MRVSVEIAQPFRATAYASRQQSGEGQYSEFWPSLGLSDNRVKETKDKGMIEL